MLINFLRQDVDTASDYADSQSRLFELIRTITAAEGAG
jgi:hypothetical protein